jgi:hypothetical protein
MDRRCSPSSATTRPPGTSCARPASCEGGERAAAPPRGVLPRCARQLAPSDAKHRLAEAVRVLVARCLTVDAEGAGSDALDGRHRARRPRQRAPRRAADRRPHDARPWARRLPGRAGRVRRAGQPHGGAPAPRDGR